MTWQYGEYSPRAMTVNFSITSETDLQFAVPGLLVRATENAYNLNFSIRGQSVDAFSFSLPAVLAYFNEVQVGAFSSPALYDLQSVQVLKGPQGTLFGRNATGGAVLYTSTKPGNELSGYVEGSYGNYSRANVEGAIDLPVVPDTLLLRVAGFFEHRDGFQRNLFNNSRIGDQERRGGRLTMTVKPADSLSNTLVADYFYIGGSSMAPVLHSAYLARSPSC
jgi:iron complex outermembrane receptor protein